MSFYWKVGLAVAAVLAAAFLLLILLPGGDKQEIKKLIEGAVEAARKGDPEAAIRSISKSYRTESEGYDDVCLTIRRFVGPGKYRDLELRNLEVQVVGDSAVARFTIRVVQPTGMPVPHFDRALILDLRKEGGAWKVTAGRSEPSR